MDVPKWADYMLPELMLLNDNKEHERRGILEEVSR